MVYVVIQNKICCPLVGLMRTKFEKNRILFSFRQIISSLVVEVGISVVIGADSICSFDVSFIDGIVRSKVILGGIAVIVDSSNDYGRSDREAVAT